MSTAKTADPTTETVQSVRELNDRVATFGRKTGASLLDAYETSAVGFADYETKLAEASPFDWLAAAGRAHATLTRDLAKAYAGAGRELIK